MPNSTNGAAVAAEVMEAAAHPLLEKKIRPIFNWSEWLAHWQAADNFQVLESLLHSGFSVALERGSAEEKDFDNVDRVIFYFSIADGWDSYGSLEIKKDEGVAHTMGIDDLGNYIKKTPAEVRQRLARKAFDMLCLNFFRVDGKNERAEEFGRFWNKLIADDRLLPVIKNFFRIEKPIFGDTRICNFPHRDERTHNEQQAVNFLVKVAKFIWSWKEEPGIFFHIHEPKSQKQEEFMLAVRNRVDSAKLWLIEVLVQPQLARLDIARQGILRLNKPCLTKLKEIALRTKLYRSFHPVAEDRLVVSVDEACYAGSSSAWFLKEHELKLREHNRLNGIIDASRKRDARKKKIEVLSGKGK